MRCFFLLFVLASIALVVGFAPRPLFIADWRAQLDEADVKGDCQRVGKIIDVVEAVGLYGEARFQRAKLYFEGKCASTYDADDEERDFYKKYGTDFYFTESQSYFTERWRSSLIGSRFAVGRGWSKLELTKPVAKARRQARAVVRACIDQYFPDFGSLPDYDLLNYAMANPDLSVDKIKKISRERRAQCVRNLLAAVRVMSAAAQTPDDRAEITRYEFSVLFLLYSAPEQAVLYEAIFSELTDEDYQRGHPELQFDKEISVMVGYVCPDEHFSGQLLASAINCSEGARLAIHQGNESFKQHSAALHAVYYAERARRLGWRNIEANLDAARPRLSEECYSAIVTLEAQDAGDHKGTRDFASHAWPVNPGEVCFDEPYAGPQGE